MLLASNPGSTVDSLRKRLNARNHPYSVPAIYQELRKLRERAVCVKVGNRYSLRLGWVLDLAALVGEAYSLHLQAIGGAIPLPKEGQKEVWKFQNLRSLGQFWTQLILVLCSVSEDKICFEWAPHAWFSLSHGGEESQFIRAMRQAKNSYYLIIGNDTALSRDYAAALGDTRGLVSFSESAFHNEKRYLSQIGTFLVTVELGEKLNRTIEKTFMASLRDVRGAIQLGVEMLDELSPIKLTLHNRPAKLRRIRRDFCEFFGVPNAGR